MEAGARQFEALRRRLYGSANRIAWRAEHIASIAAHFGIGRDIDLQLGAASAYRPIAETIASAKASAAVDDERRFTFTISTGEVDRMGDTIAVDGWKLAAFRRNPVVLWAHDGGLLPVGRATDVWVAGNKLKATALLAPADVSASAETVGRMIATGYLAATSVGFLPLKFTFSQDPKRPYGIDFLEQELLEFSIVPVPANPNALIDAGQQSPKSARDRDRDRRRREVDLLRARGGP